MDMGETSSCSERNDAWDRTSMFKNCSDARMVRSELYSSTGTDMEMGPLEKSFGCQSGVVVVEGANKPMALLS